MRVNLQLFAALRESVGQRHLTLELDEGARVSDLRDRLARDFPAIMGLLPSVAFAIDDEYVAAEAMLCDGMQVAAIPPVSGGSDQLFRVTDEVLDAQRLADLVRRDEAGAIALFYGVVRNHSEGRQVIKLEYEAHESMALSKLAEAAAETRQRFPEINEVGAWHRVGTLAIGETSLLVAVSSPHRQQAFEACYWCVDRIKEVVPVWKKEYFEGGATWLDGHIIEAPASS